MPERKYWSKKGCCRPCNQPGSRRVQVMAAPVNSQWRVQLPNGVSVAFAGAVDAGSLATVLNTAASVE